MCRRISHYAICGYSRYEGMSAFNFGSADLTPSGVSTALMAIIDGQSYFQGTGADLVIAYYTLSVALNLVATVAISAKLWAARRRLRDVSSMPTPYVSVSAILIESAFLYTVCGIAFLVPFGLADPFQNVILPTLAQVEVRWSHP